ncbi:MAG TPA: winged helix-turn-helix domain-containing protein [Vicinamibacteria bacterium]|nr:winged helix-turn-helix domain-containing protein [Vicinamibacteria bacterium]
MEKIEASPSRSARPLHGGLRFGPFCFDVATETLSRNGAPVSLPPRATQVLRQLLVRPGELVLKEILLDAAWNGVAVSEQSLSEAIKVLRRALDDDPRKPRYIQTVHRRGFRFVGSLDGAELPGPPRPRPSWRLWIAVSTVPTLFLGWYLGHRAPVSLPPAELVARGAEPDSGSLSPDGKKLAFTTWAGGVVVRDLESGEDTFLDRRGGLLECPPVWSPDGSSLAYRFREADQTQIRVIAPTASAPRIVDTSERELFVTDWSPDGKRLLLLRQAPEDVRFATLAELTLETGTVRDVASVEWVWPPRAFYSPDGKRIAYGSGDGDRGTIHVYDRERHRDVELTHPHADEGFPLWSPDGRYLLHRSRSDEDWDLWALRLDGLERAGGPYLIQDRVGDSYPWSWTRDGTLLSVQKSQRGEMWRLRREGEPSRFSEQLEQSVQEGVPSPTGEWVAVKVEGESSSKSFYLLSRSEARLLPLTSELPRSSVIGWSPDESWFLLWGRSPANEDVFLRFHLAENAARPVEIEAGPPLMGHYAALSPDGRLLVLEEGNYDCERRLVLVNLESGLRSPLGVGGCKLMSAWSPDGREIVVGRHVTGQESDIIVISTGGDRLRTLASWQTEGFGSVGPIAWSPDGTSIVLLLHPLGLNELWELPAEGGELRLLYRPERIDPWKPYWPTEDSGIFFTAMRMESRLWKRRDVLARLQSN